MAAEEVVATEPQVTEPTVEEPNADEPNGEAALDAGAGDTAPDADDGTSTVPEKPTGDKAPGDKQAKSLFAQLHDEEFGKPAEPKPEELPADVKPGTRAADEIIRLRQRAQRAEGEIGNFQQVMQQRDSEVSNYLQQVQGQLQQTAQQNAELRGRLEELTRRGPVAPDKDDNPYVTSLMERFGKEIVSPQLAPVLKEVQQAREENMRLTKELQARDEKVEIQRRADTIRQQAGQHFYDLVLRGVPKEEAAEDAGLGTALTLAMMRANPGADMKQSAAKLRAFVLRAADKISRNAKLPTAKALERKQEAPDTINRGGVGGKVKEKMPSPEQLSANGFMTPWEWMEAGRPQLKNKSAS